MKIIRDTAHRGRINPVLYHVFLRLKTTLDAEIVHRRGRKSATCIEIIFHNDLCKDLHGRLNTLPEAEEWGFWVILRRQTNRGHGTWHGRTVYQLFLSPVHPKKRRWNLSRAESAVAPKSVSVEEIAFEPIVPHRHRQAIYPQNIEFYSTRQKKTSKHLRMSKKCCTFARYFDGKPLKVPKQ